MKNRIKVAFGEWNICVFPFSIIISPAKYEGGKTGSSIAIGFLIWAVSIFIYDK